MSAFLGILLAFTTMILWGFTDLMAKISLNKESRWKLLFIGQLCGGLLISIFAFFSKGFKIDLNNAAIYLILLGLMNLAGMYLFYKSMKEKGISLSVPIANSWIFITVILSFIFYKEAISVTQWFAIGMIISGIFVMAFQKSALNFDRHVLSAVFSMLVFGVFMFLLKVPNLVFGAVVVTSSIKLLTALFSAPVLFMKKIRIFQTERKILFYIILIGIMDSLGFLAFNFALRYELVFVVSSISSASAILSLLLGVFILKEKISKWQAIGIIAAIFGLVLISL